MELLTASTCLGRCRLAFFQCLLVSFTLEGWDIVESRCHGFGSVTGAYNAGDYSMLSHHGSVVDPCIVSDYSMLFGSCGSCEGF